MSTMIDFEQGEPDFLVCSQARPSDARAIASIVQQRVPTCLPVDPWQVARHHDRYLVRRVEGRVVATAALFPIGPHMLELRSVAVAQGWENRGLGSEVVRGAIARAIARGKNLYCVTTHPGFFESLGFRAAPLGMLPEKPERERCPVADQRQAMGWIASGLRQLNRRWRHDIRATA